MSNFSNTKRIAFSFSRSKISTSKNIKNEDSIPYCTNLYNSLIYQPNPVQRQTSSNQIIQYPDSLGLYTYWSEYDHIDTNFFKDIQIEEYDINLNSGDRDISVNSNPLNFTVWLSPGSTRTKSFLPRVFKNVKYISFEHVIFPKYTRLNKYDGSTDISANIYITDISNSIRSLKINDDIVSSINPLVSYQICNVQTNGLNTNVNFTVNFCTKICWELVYNNQTYTKVLNKYIPSLTSGSSNYIQHICIQPTNNKFLFNTKNISEFRPLFPKINNNTDLYYAIKKTYVVYKNSDLLNIYKFDIKLLDSTYTPIQINNLDSTIPISKCTCCFPTGDIKYSCKCYYPRHPMYYGYQIDLFLKIGTLVQELNRKTYFD